MIKGILFDMDGVVIDSNHIHYENWSSLFKKKFNVEIDKKDFGMQLGRSARHFTEYFLEKFHINATYDSLFPDIQENYVLLSHKIELKQGFRSALMRIRKKYRTALATGANKDMALEIISRFKLNFDFVIGGNEVTRAKPDPEIFLRAAAGLHLKPGECIVIEDAVLGMQAAKSAGIKVIAIPDEFTKFQDHSIADLKLNSISELNEKTIEKLG